MLCNGTSPAADGCSYLESYLWAKYQPTLSRAHARLALSLAAETANLTHAARIALSAAEGAAIRETLAATAAFSDRSSRALIYMLCICVPNVCSGVIPQPARLVCDRAVWLRPGLHCNGCALPCAGGVLPQPRQRSALSGKAFACSPPRQQRCPGPRRPPCRCRARRDHRKQAVAAPWPLPWTCHVCRIGAGWSALV